MYLGPSNLRAALLSALALSLPPLGWLYAEGGLPMYWLLVVPLGAVLGAFLATAGATGLAESDAAPSTAVRQEVLAQHAASRFPAHRDPLSKRAFDIAASLTVLVVTLPLWLVIGLLVWLEEPGPVFFVKHSVGRGGVTFRQLKFRSMRYGAEHLTGPVPSPAGDTRVLRVGRWLRRWHLDELSEVLNVLAGTMSLVGPRPLRTMTVLRYLQEVPGYAERHSVRPGIACIAQIERSHHRPADRLRKDRVYVRRRCLRLDLWLLWRAVVTTVGDRRDRGPARQSPDPQSRPTHPEPTTRAPTGS